MKIFSSATIFADIQSGYNIDHFIDNYDLHLLLKELETWATHPEYMHEPSRRLLEDIKKLKPLSENPDLVI